MIRIICNDSATISFRDTAIAVVDCVIVVIASELTVAKSVSVSIFLS